MRKLMLVAVALLVWAGPANAKELLGAQLCGASGCATQRDAGLREGHGSPLGDGAVTPPAKAGPWYRGSLLLGDQGKVFGRYPFYYVPDGHFVVEPGHGGQVATWTHPQGRLAELLERLSRTLKPHAIPKLTSVAVNGRNAADPQSYLELYAIGEKATTYPTDGIGTQVVLETAKPTPWSDGNYVVVYPDSDLMVRDGEIVSIPGAIADRAARGASLDVGSHFPWLLIVGASAASAVLILALWLRRRPRLVPRPVVQA